MSFAAILPALLLALAASAVFSGFETGSYTVNRIRLELRAKDPRDRLASRLSALLAKPDELLCVFLVGNNLANALAAMLGELWIRGLLPPEESGRAPLLIGLVLTPLLFLSSEALPKHLFHLNTETWTYRLAPVLWVSGRILRPLTLLVVPLAHAALAWAAGLSELTGLRRQLRALEGLLEAGGAELGRSLRERAIGLRLRQERRVRQCMSKADDVVVLPEDADAATLKAALARSPHRRYPLRAPDGDTRRYVYFLDPFRSEKAGAVLKDWAFPLVDLTPDLPLWRALVLLERSGSRMGVVRDRRGRPVGYVTAGDLAKGLLDLGA